MPHFSRVTSAVCAVIVFASANLFAQEVRTFALSHGTSQAKSHLPVSPSFVRAQPETIRVLSAMVEFSPDTDPLTTGNGLFDTSTSAVRIIDPPPHNRSYFQHHLTFLHNYWKRVTNGNLIVLADVVDTVVRLPRGMRSYSPPQNSSTNTELARLVHDTWRSVDSLQLKVNGDSIVFSNYGTFCIFHAGVGRDVDLTSLFGFDPTPFDIPSLYFDSLGLQRALGGGYRGVPVRDSSFFIANSMILPETESRTIATVGGEFLLQLGINGLLAASFGSYLGLPDLFDTRTGRSGIGRFGLMDGESIFSWGGVFPPEPSAWEKYFLDRTYNLGMLRMVDANPGSSVHGLPAVSSTESGMDTILRVPISAKEYFLVENRNRDAQRNGVRVVVVVDGDTMVRTFQRDTTGFHAFDQDSLYGIVVDVDEFDWSLPGGVSRDGEFFDGGILIWHIDETVIEANYASNSVNANPSRRGVDLEEADGSQDIGQPYGFLDPGSGSESGTALDFWFSGNSSPVYRNNFSHTSHPNSLSNAGANSFITIKDFPSRAPSMSVTVQRGENLAQPLPGYPRFVGHSLTDNSPQYHKALFVGVGDSLFAFRVDTAVSATPDARGVFDSRGGRYPVTFVPSASDTIVVVGVHDSTVRIWHAVDADTDKVFDVIRGDTMNLGGRLTTSPLVEVFTTGPVEIAVLYVGDEKGILHRIVLDGGVRTKVTIGNAPVTSVALLPPVSVSVSNLAVAVSGDTLRVEDGRTLPLPYSSAGWQVVTSEERVVVADVGGQTLLLLDNDLNVVHQMAGVPGKISPLAVADIDGDGKRDVVFGAGKKLYVMNQIGSMVDHYPLTLPAPISGAPVVARLAPDRTLAHIVVTTVNGLVFAYNSKGIMHDGFPLALSGPNRSTPAVFAYETLSLSRDYPVLFLVDSAGYLSAWRLADVPKGFIAPWGSYRGDIFHTGTDTTAPTARPLPAEFLPASRAYNWPNPVYDGRTYIRYFVRENATVRIKIYDLAGEVVDELTGPGIGGFDNEIEWNASRVQSGVYFGRIEAEAGGARGVAIIKIAVVK